MPQVPVLVLEFPDSVKIAFHLPNHSLSMRQNAFFSFKHVLAGLLKSWSITKD